MCQVSFSNLLLLACHCLRVMHSISCHHVHFICIHVRLMHPSLFPVVRFAIRRSYVTCHAFHIMSSCAFHLHTCSSHASEPFPRCPFCNPALLCHPVSLSTSFRVWGLNIFGLDRDLSCGLGLLPVDRLSSFVPFGLRLILQRLTEEPKRPRACCSPTPLQFGPKPT